MCVGGESHESVRQCASPLPGSEEQEKGDSIAEERRVYRLHLSISVSQEFSIDMCSYAIDVDGGVIRRTS